MNFPDFAESDLILWLRTHPLSCSMDDFAPGVFSGLLRTRISFRAQIGLQLSIPAQQQIDAETATQFLGMASLVIAASTVLTLTGRARADFAPSPDYSPPDGLSPYWGGIRFRLRYYFASLWRGERMAGHYQAATPSGNAHPFLGRT